MRHLLRLPLAPFVLCLLLLLVVALPSLAQLLPLNALPNPYRALPGWGEMPAGRSWGATAAVDVARDGKTIWVAERCGANSCTGSNLAPILKFDGAGKLLASFGAGLFVFPHGIHVDAADNVWVTDGLGDSGKGHQVLKFSPDGKLLLTLGRAGQPGDAL